MANPVELLNKAAENRKRRAKQVQIDEHAQNLPENPESTQAAFMRPLPNGHGAYSALMRKHDRVHLRIGS